ncbi:SMP-30/gluconolactonase/LRE family protein [Mesorhizobium shangrilense]|uniref:SMP-30/gluconolactonase/LRE family protein n=1 Tax=Mesorhizobium shangrilense TaxID=460060 RepID=A0ABV2DS46_9HYPH
MDARRDQDLEPQAVVVHDANALTGECPCWDPRSDVLWWIDIQGQRLLSFSPRSGERRAVNLPLMPGLITNRRAGGLIVGLEDGFYAFDLAKGLSARLVAAAEEDGRLRLNDGKADLRGRLWFGSMDKTGGGGRWGGLFVLDTDGSVRKILSDITIPNAIAWSPDGSVFYFSDSVTKTIDAYDYDLNTGSLSHKCPFAVYDEGETPDGVCIDREGGVWIAVVHGNRVERRLPDGRLDRIVPLQVSRPTMPMLGGVNGSTLFVTSQRRFLTTAELAAQPAAGDLLAIDVGIPAAPCAMAAI